MMNKGENIRWNSEPCGRPQRIVRRGGVIACSPGVHCTPVLSSSRCLSLPPSSASTPSSLCNPSPLSPPLSSRTSASALSLPRSPVPHQGAAFLFSTAMAAKVPFSKRWIKPEIYPLFVAIGSALGICGYAMARNLAINPDVRISKEDRAAGILENYKEGEAYKMHSLRSFAEKKEPQIMPGLNNYFSSAK